MQKVRRRYCRCFVYVGPIVFGILLQLAPLVHADDYPPPGYPPGWNIHTPAGQILYDFRPGCVSDTKRYWPDCVHCTKTAMKSRNATVNYTCAPDSLGRNSIIFDPEIYDAGGN